MTKRERIEMEIHQKEKRIAQWEKFRTVPNVTETIRILNKRNNPYFTGGSFGE